VCGNVPRVVAGADEAAMLKKIESQIAKKFAAKGGAIVAGNMEVIKEGLEETVAVDYDQPAFAETAAAASGPKRTVAVSAAMCRTAGATSAAGFFDADYYE
ncbi:hypothetical protein J8J40_25660, partial [Mycobacterium tuberculosis]|nr:hypothetical protein [Mycobacterium tuberculosis]